ncbi:hypothetical protein MMYC01_202707 [Madurella mycetomatis]|uniref:Uncharacterized protein n=1 Tax=Madurella mycetomatis TaxID=100816 RepID=A0A175WCE8_9PEZI|nr:hypothetical protein MMYC01_202707 [Madurella mycetomatis]
MDLVTYFARDLDDDTKQAILNIFGARGTASLDSMAPYFEYYRQELKSSIIFSCPPIRTHKDALEVFELLKANATKPKMAIHAPQGAAAALDLGVRTMLVTACKTPGTFGGDVFNPVWQTDETLVAFINRVYPRWAGPIDDRRSTSITVTRITAHALTTDARIRIEWTDRLTDHLELLVGADWKTIYVFRYPCYLKMCLRALLASKPELDHNTADALALGCLPPDLLIETLSTYNLLFPSTDGASQVILRNAAKHDPAFAESFSVFSQGHEGPQDARNPGNIADLYKKFPRWGERLDVLWKEIENPTPVTRIERWSDKRKSARWATWWVVLGLLFASLFGLMATVLGALQVWISYCSWRDDPMVPGCSTKSVTSSTISSTSATPDPS